MAKVPKKAVRGKYADGRDRLDMPQRCRWKDGALHDPSLERESQRLKPGQFSDRSTCRLVQSAEF